MKIVQLTTGKNSIKIQVSLLLDRDDLVRRIGHQVEVFGKAIPSARKDIVNLVLDDIRQGYGIKMDLDYLPEATLVAIETVVDIFFPELR